MVISHNAGVETILNRINDKLGNIESTVKNKSVVQTIQKGCVRRGDLSNEFLTILNDRCQEEALCPYAEWSENTLNVYWKNIEKASEYKVAIYKNVGRIIYKIKDFILQRTECYLSVDKLVGNGYIIKVYAYDRSGMVISEARAIDGNGTPISW